ncbi:hypothetical protein B5F98_00595 [Pseudoflavonifractor sp. An44]|nr:hypothetical protein B5F98_00595 [Pseudoflavonifractor sp. An44]
MECLRCKAEMFTAKFCADAVRTGAYLSNKKKGIFESERISGVTCYVCPVCGHIELIANEPQKVKLDR